MNSHSIRKHTFKLFSSLVKLRFYNHHTKVCAGLKIVQSSQGTILSSLIWA